MQDRLKAETIIGLIGCICLVAGCSPGEADHSPAHVAKEAEENQGDRNSGLPIRGSSEVAADDAATRDLAVQQYPADSCSALVLHDVPSPNGGLVKGSVRTLITQYWIAKDGAEKFCEKGAGCYPARAYVAGVGETNTVRFLNCRRGELFADDEDGLGFYMELDRNLTTDEARRLHDVKSRLVDLGMGLASADNAALHYINKPNERCGRLVRAMLEGDPAAEMELVPNMPTFCQFD